MSLWRPLRAIPMALLLTGLSTTFPVIAQLPTAAEPGRQAPIPVMPMPSTAGGPIRVPEAPAVQAPLGSEHYSFKLETLAIEGATAFTAVELESLYRDRVGQELSVRDLFAIANALEVKYRSAGYVTSRVLVPEQEIEGGRFRIQVIEGFVSDIVLSGDIGAASAAVRQLMEPLRTSKPVSVIEIERRLLLANDLAGLTVRGRLEPSPSELGGSVIVVETERKARDVRVSLDNRNSEYLGKAGLAGSVSFNSIGSRADRVNASARTSLPLGRAWSLAGSYDALLSENGLTGSFSSSLARSEPGLELRELDVESMVVSEVVALTYPLLRSRRENLRAFGEFEYRDVRTDVTNTDFNRDRLRILRGGLSYDRADRWQGVTAARVTLHQGLDVLNATDQGSDLASRFNGHSDFTKLTADLTRIQQLSDRISVLGTLTTQWTSRAVLASEEIALGGPNFARAYNDGEVAGDSGWTAAVELRYHQMQAAWAPHGVQYATFLDGGQVWSKSDDRFEGSQGLMSAGVAVRANLRANLYVTAEVAAPLNRDVQTEGNRDPRAFFGLVAHY